MATTILLIRHAEHELLGRVLCGRMPGVTLGERGRRQAVRLGSRLETGGLAALYTSPLDRARETAAAIGTRCGLAPVASEALNEIDFGRWTGARFDSLAPDPAWQRWNAARDIAQLPEGEAMGEAQARAVAGILQFRERHPDATVAAVSHADIIKGVLAWCLRMPLDAHAQFEIGPASISAMVLWEGGAKVLWMNEAARA